MLTIHIGVPKSGTTTLQEAYFPHHSGLDFRGWPNLPSFFKALYSDGVALTNVDFVRAREEAARAFRSDQCPVVLSREHLTRHTSNIGLLAERLAAILGVFKVIITTREQLGLLESGYLWDYRLIRRPWAGGIPPRTIRKYLQNDWQTYQRWGHGSRIGAANYAGIIRLYEKTIGQENIGVFPLEELINQPKQYASRLSEFIGADPSQAPTIPPNENRNPRLSKRQALVWTGMAYALPAAVHKFVSNRMPRSFDEFLTKGQRFSAPMPNDWIQRLTNFYAEGNGYIEQTYNLPLTRYGYATRSDDVPEAG